MDQQEVTLIPAPLETRPGSRLVRNVTWAVASGLALAGAAKVLGSLDTSRTSSVSDALRLDEAPASAGGQTFCCWWPQPPESDICGKCTTRNDTQLEWQCSGTGTWCEAKAMPLVAVLKDADGRCLVPANFCKGQEASGGVMDQFSYRDCDGDGILDPYCEGGELLRFGYLGSLAGCKNNWPNGLCIKRRQPSGDVAMSAGMAASNEITVIHFNDVYQVAGVLEKGVRRGGMSRAAHIISEERRRNPNRTFVVFAGDLLSPSVLSDLFEGAQMIDILNGLKLDAASLGNHEFDFGVDTLAKRVKESNFPWLNINLMDEHGELLEGTIPRVIRDVPFAPMWSDDKNKTSRVCLFGSAYDVRETMYKDVARVTHKGTIDAAKVEVKHLREEEHCDLVLALTHQFSREDCEMSKVMGDSIDLILGGHDHSTELTTVCGHAPYVKADLDLKTQWIMTLWLDDNGKVNAVDGRLLSLTDADPFDEELHEKIVDWENKGMAELGKPMGCSTVGLDALAEHVRQFETNLGNFFTDSVKSVHKTDVAMINGGTIRGGKVFGKGILSKKTITEMHPFGNAIVKVYATGSDLRKYIEKQLDCYSDRCGNFVNVAGLNYTYRPSAPKGSRLVKLTYPNGTAVGDCDKMSVAMSDFMLANSNMRQNKLYNMVTLNDAVPIVQSLFTATEAAGDACIGPQVDGRMKNAEA